MSVACIISTILGLAMPASSCDQAAPEPVNVQFLSSDAHLVIGGQRFVLPFVAIRSISFQEPHSNVVLYEEVTLDSRHQLMLRLAGDPSNPMPTASVEIAVGTYKFHSEQTASTGICPRLTRQWARQLCRGHFGYVIGNLPGTFILIDRGFLSRLERYWAAEGETMSDRVAAMQPLSQGNARFTCDADKHCFAAILLFPDVLAVWSMGSRSEDTLEKRAESQGAAILAFAKYAIGDHEDLDRLQ